MVAPFPPAAPGLPPPAAIPATPAIPGVVDVAAPPVPPEPPEPPEPPPPSPGLKPLFLPSPPENFIVPVQLAAKPPKEIPCLQAGVNHYKTTTIIIHKIIQNKRRKLIYFFV